MVAKNSNQKNPPMYVSIMFIWCHPTVRKILQYNLSWNNKVNTVFLAKNIQYSIQDRSHMRDSSWEFVKLTYEPLEVAVHARKKNQELCSALTPIGL